MDIGTLTGTIQFIYSADAIKRAAGDVLGFAEKVGGPLAAAGLEAATAIAGLTATVVALGNRGADINDVAATLDQFAGSAKNAADIMEGLRKGTLGTIDDFDLLKFASKTLQAGVKLTADNFKTLGEAAFVLQNRGLGSTNEMLSQLSRALVTGRTRFLEMQIGVIDFTKAQKDLQKELGVDKLNRLQDAEARRTAILAKMSSVVKEAGPQERDFGETLEFVHAKITNYTDALGQAIASSPGVKVAMDLIAEGFDKAFGAGQEDLIKGLALAIGNLAIFAVRTASIIIEVASRISQAFIGAASYLDEYLKAFKDKELANAQKTLDALLVAPEGTGPSDRKIRIQQLRIEIGKLTAESASLGKSSTDLATTQAWLNTKTAEAQKYIDDMIAAMNKAQEAGQNGIKVSHGQAEGIKQLTEEQKKYLAELQKIREHLLGIDAVQKFDKIRSAMGGVIDVTKLSAAGMKEVQEAAEGALEGYRQLHQAAPKDVSEINDKLKEKLATLNAISHILDGLKIRYSDFAVAARSFVGPVAQVAAPTTTRLGMETDWKTLETQSIASLQHTADVARNTYIDMTNRSGEFSKAAIRHQKQIAEAAQAAADGTMTAWDRTYQALGAVGDILNNISGKFAEVAAIAARTGQAVMDNLASGNIWGAVIAGVTGTISAIKKLFTGSTEGRDAVKAFAASFAGGFDGPDGLHDQLLKKLGNIGEDLWKELTQQVSRGSASQAAAVIAKIQDALQNAPASLAESAGYKTRDQLLETAETARKVYEYMRDSGQYTAAAVADAFTKSTEAARAAMDDTSSAALDAANASVDLAKNKLKELDDQLKSLQDSIAGEAPEEYMGVIEANTRKQIEDVTKQRNAAAAALDDTVDKAAQAAKEAGDIIDKALQDRKFKINVDVNFTNMPDYGHVPSGVPVPSSAVTPGAVPPREGGGTANLVIDGIKMAEVVVPHIPGVVTNYGLT